MPGCSLWRKSNLITATATFHWLPSMSGCSLWQLYLSHFFDSIYTTFPISCQISPVFSFADFLKKQGKISILAIFDLMNNRRKSANDFQRQNQAKGLKIHTNPVLFLLSRLWNPHVSLLLRSNDWLLRKCCKQTENGPLVKSQLCVLKSGFSIG